MKAMGVRLAGIALAMIGSGVMAETLPPPMGLVATHTEQQRCKGGI